MRGKLIGWQPDLCGQVKFVHRIQFGQGSTDAGFGTSVAVSRGGIDPVDAVIECTGQDVPLCDRVVFGHQLRDGASSD